MLLTLLACLATPSAIAVEGPSDLAYEIRVVDPERALVEVRLKLEGLDGPVGLELPQGTTFAQLPEPRLEGPVRVLSGDGASIEPRGPYSWELLPGACTRVELSWSVPLDHRTLPEVRGRDEYEFPYLAHDHGLLTMSSLAIAPHAGEPERLRVAFRLPAGWEVHAPWPEREEGHWAPPSLGALTDDMIAIGNWDVEQRDVAGMHLALAFAPGQERLLETVVERAPAIVAAELELFGCTPQESYLFLFGRPEQQGYGGSPKTNSMTLFVAPDLPPEFAVDGLEHLIAHEFHHTWMRARCQLPDELRFVGEGFTDYYAYLVPWRLGLRDDAHLLSVLEEKLDEYELAQTGGTRTLAEAGGPAFFEGGSAYQATYSGGLVLALWLDLALRQAVPVETLDELLRNFYEDPRWRSGERPDSDDLWDLVERAAGAQVAERGRGLVGAQGVPDLVAAFSELGVELGREVRPAALDMRANMDGTTLTALDPKGLAQRVGLRAGDRLLEVNGQAVEDEAQVRRHWARLQDDEIWLVVQRPGSEQPLELRVPRPEEVRHGLPGDLLERLR